VTGYLRAGADPFSRARLINVIRHCGDFWALFEANHTKVYWPFYRPFGEYPVEVVNACHGLAIDGDDYITPLYAARRDRAGWIKRDNLYAVRGRASAAGRPSWGHP